MSQALIVLGMHRSGTSAVAGALSRLGGCAPQTLLPAHPDNPKGYWESAPLVELNDRILAAAGSVWHDWRPIDERWFDSETAARFAQEVAQTLYSEFPGDAPAVLKDPRICRIFPIWKRALDLAGRQPIVISPLRRPAEVARSLARRDAFTLERANLIWLRHVLEAERVTRDIPRLICRWSDFLGDWRSVVSRFTAETGARLIVDEASAAEVDTFLDAELRRNRQADTVTSEAAGWIAPAFAALVRLQDDPDDAQAKAELDLILHAFDESAAIYGPVFAGMETEYNVFHTRFKNTISEAVSRAASVEAELQRVAQLHLETQQTSARETDAMTKALQDMETQLASMKATEQLLRQDLQQAANALTIAENEIVDMTSRADRLDREVRESQVRAADMASTLEQAQSERDRRKTEALEAQNELRRLARRRRGRPLRTAWAVLRGQEA